MLTHERLGKALQQPEQRGSEQEAQQQLDHPEEHGSSARASTEPRLQHSRGWGLGYGAGAAVRCTRDRRSERCASSKAGRKPAEAGSVVLTKYRTHGTTRD